MTTANKQIRRSLISAAALAALLSFGIPAFAAPGAHGPGGEHIDMPNASAGATGARPGLEARSEAFELVATLQADGLSILIDRYDTNEPVLGATLEVESSGIKAQAKFHADHGDYGVDDAALLALLRTPGEHALVFTLVAGADADLLDGTLHVPASAAAGGHADDHGHGLHAWEIAALAAGGLVLAGGVVVLMRRRRRSRDGSNGSSIVSAQGVRA